MKNTKKLLTTVGLTFSLVTAAVAVPITGSIEFGGNNSILNNEGPSSPGTIDELADHVEWEFAYVSAVFGDFSVIDNLLDDGFGAESATFTDFRFGELGETGALFPTINPLWEVTDSNTGFLYSFELTHITGNEVGSGQRTIAGMGYVTVLDGAVEVFDRTEGTWEFSQSGSASFTASTTVPDGGTTALLLGLGLTGIAVVSRRLKK